MFGPSLQFGRVQILLEFGGEKEPSFWPLWSIGLNYDGNADASINTQAYMEKEQLQERITIVESKREYLLRLLEKPNLGTLRVDVNQALEELDDLIAEFKRTFPDRE